MRHAATGNAPALPTLSSADDDTLVHTAATYVLWPRAPLATPPPSHADALPLINTVSATESECIVDDK